MSKLSKRLMALHHYIKNGNNIPNFSDVLHLKITIHIPYRYKQIKLSNLVYFGSPSIASQTITPLYPLIYRLSLYSLNGR